MTRPLTETMMIDKEEVEQIGWLIESRWWPESWERNDKMIKKHTDWKAWRQHIYKTKEIGEDALKQCPYRMRNEEFRFRELFKFKDANP